MLEKLGLAVENFLNNYGTAFLMMAVAGLIIALVIELAVKNAFAWLEKKFDGKDKVLDALNIAKMSVIFVLTIALTAASTKILMAGGLQFPGNKALAPIWFAVIYFCQYGFSVYGIKSLLGLKDREPKQKKERKDPLEGLQKLSDNCYTDGAGNYFNKKGKKL